MNTQLSKLFDIAAAPSRKIIGLMSGTSLDGLDIALCNFTGSGLSTAFQLLHFITVPYPESFKAELKAIAFKTEVELLKLTLLNAKIGSYSAELVLMALQKWNIDPSEVDLIASHGQTIFHAPISLHHLPEEPNATLQIGDGDHIAQGTGIITLSDFRQKHVAAGGEGAPLAVYGDYLLYADNDESRILLNIGGISNFTCLPKGKRSEEVFSTDIGPGNTLMDQFVQKHFPGFYFDKDAAFARAGNTNAALLAALTDHPFLIAPFPKTTGPELFNLSYLERALIKIGNPDLSTNDVLASLCEFTAYCIVQAISSTIGDQPYQVYISGGGMHNPLLMQKINEGLGFKVKDSDLLGIAPDAKEAVLFALLANECVAGNAKDFAANTAIPAVSLGKISLPK